MRVASLTIENFPGIRSGTVRFRDHTVLIGPNNSAKTTIEPGVLKASRLRYSRPPSFHLGAVCDPCISIVTSSRRSLLSIVTRAAIGTLHAMAIGERMTRNNRAGSSRHGPKGGRFTVVVATPAGAARAAGLWATEGRASQRVFSGAVKSADMRHDVAVYRAACEARARIEAEAAAERQRSAAELDLPVARGKVLFPDAQIEYVNAAGLTSRCNVEVASEHYGG